MELQQAAAAVTAGLASCDGRALGKQTQLQLLSAREFDCLMAVWAATPKPDGPLLTRLAQQSDRPLQRIRKFFQNQRATHNRKRKAEEPPDAAPAPSSRDSGDGARGATRAPLAAHDMRDNAHAAAQRALHLLLEHSDAPAAAAAEEMHADPEHDCSRSRGPTAMTSCCAAAMGREAQHAQPAEFAAASVGSAAAAASAALAATPPAAAAKPTCAPPAQSAAAGACACACAASTAGVSASTASSSSSSTSSCSSSAAAHSSAASASDAELVATLQRFLTRTSDMYMPCAPGADAPPAPAAAAAPSAAAGATLTRLEQFSAWLRQRGIDSFSCAWRCGPALAELVELYGRINSTALLVACSCVLQCAFSQCALPQPLSLRDWQQLLGDVGSAAKVCRRSDMLWLHLRKDGPRFSNSAPDKAREDTLTAIALVGAIAPHHAQMSELVSSSSSKPHASAAQAYSAC
jgi:hypothetical protein